MGLEPTISSLGGGALSIRPHERVNSAWLGDIQVDIKTCRSSNVLALERPAVANTPSKGVLLVTKSLYTRDF